MGWLFAVCLGLQERQRKAVLAALPPIALGHALSVGLIVALVALLRTTVQPAVLKYSAAAILIGYGLYRVMRARHPRWVGMRVGFRDLTLWSFLMASAHGAGLMIVPILLGWPDGNHAGHAAHFGAMSHAAHGSTPGTSTFAGPVQFLAAVGVHSAGYLLVLTLIALLVYEKLAL